MLKRIEEVRHSFKLLSDVGIQFTDEQKASILDIEMPVLEQILPRVETEIKQSFQNLICSWRVQIHHKSDGVIEFSIINAPQRHYTKSELQSIDEVYDSINVLRELGLPVSDEQKVITKRMEASLLKDEILPQLSVQLKSLFSSFVSCFSLNVSYKFKGNVKIEIDGRTNSNKAQKSPTKSGTHQVFNPHNFHVNIKILQSVFDKKVTSYKYFWFYAIVSLSNETEHRVLAMDRILAKMIATAWPIILKDDIDFGKADMMRKFVTSIKEESRLTETSSSSEVFSYLCTNKNASSVKTAYSKLSKNVPYRFLSPWIKYSSDEQVIRDSSSPTSGCPYALAYDSITIHEEWFTDIKANKIDLLEFVISALKEYLMNFNEERQLVNISV